MRRAFTDVILPLAVALALAFVVQAALAKPYEIPTGSMEPTIQPHDRVVANRVIDRVEVRGGVTYVNGEPYVVEQARPPDYEKTWPPVPDGELLVLGDNRPNSCDSHQWTPDPFLPEDAVIGQAEVVYWPPKHLGFLD